MNLKVDKTQKFNNLISSNLKHPYKGNHFYHHNSVVSMNTSPLVLHRHHQNYQIDSKSNDLNLSTQLPKTYLNNQKLYKFFLKLQSIPSNRVFVVAYNNLSYWQVGFIYHNINQIFELFSDGSKIIWQETLNLKLFS